MDIVLAVDRLVEEAEDSLVEVGVLLPLVQADSKIVHLMPLAGKSLLRLLDRYILPCCRFLREEMRVCPFFCFSDTEI